MKRVGKKYKMRGIAEHLVGFPQQVNKFSKSGALMQDSVYHITQRKLTFYK